MTEENLRLVQLFHPEYKRWVALVEEPSLVLLEQTDSVYELALEAIRSNKKISELVRARSSKEKLDYSSVYNGRDSWKLLPSFDHPQGPMGCTVSGTGLTHKNSALNRQMMHQAAGDKITDSMQIYQWGLEGGWPEKGNIGVQPEWFYKGNGAVLKAHGEALRVPSFGNDGGEEPEIAGIYVVDEQGRPWRIGFSTANEFSDHVMEKKNYLYLAPSKLRDCAIGPELVLTEEFHDYEGTVRIIRGQGTVWSAPVRTGEKNMAHNLRNLEYHHFKYPSHRLPLQAHVHFFGADAFSFGNQVKLQDGDLMEISWQGMGRPLQNYLEVSTDEEKIIEIMSV